ncbi:hypothetical protein TrLO_g11483 [Triparma laevis f. longispina]|uniref:Uncharacterized protein n=1 Tax=Triparma laevis f. longispina TaxID=1714387 RepID=A0A9W7CDH7_9STRA|nr:hypothetical protein TrLO_g11483 [Triparma laevis f. longispina]
MFTLCLANIVHALGGMGVRSDKVVRFVEDNAERILVKAEPQAIVNIAYTFAKLFKASRYFEALDRENVVDELVNGTPQDTSNTIWAIATLGEKAGTLAHEINTVETSRIIVNGTPQAISNMIWATQQMKLACLELVTEIIRDADRIMANGNPQDLSNIAYALADLGYFDKSVFVAVAGQTERFTRHGTDQCLCNLLWSFAVAGNPNSSGA